MSGDRSAEVPTRGPRTRFADALRVAINAVVATQLDDDELTAASEQLEAVNARLAEVAGSKRRSRSQSDPSGDLHEFFPTSPVIGSANPLSPPVHIKLVEGPDGCRQITGTVTYGYPYEGPPTCVHGGVIAEMFDEVLGAANLAAGNAGMTASLAIRYLKPTPLGVALRVEARFLRREGRKIFAWGGLYHGDVLTAEAEGVFIEVGPAQFLAIAEGNVDTADPVVLAAIMAEAARTGAASDVQAAHLD